MKVFYLLAVLGPAVACTDVVSPVASRGLSATTIVRDVIQNDRTPVTFVLSACNGEMVSVTGENHYVVNVNTNAKGDTKVSITSDSHFSGVGASTGAKY